MSVAGRSKTPSSRNPSHLGFRSADGTSVDLDATNRSQALEIESEVQRVLLEYELEEIQRDVDALVKSFDDRLRELRSRWCKTMSLVQYQAMRQLVMWQELQMLQVRPARACGCPGSMAWTSAEWRQSQPACRSRLHHAPPPPSVIAARFLR